MKRETENNIFAFAIFLGIISLICGAIFWLQCSDGYSCSTLVFDNHGISNYVYWIILFLVMEIVFVFLCTRLKKEKKETWLTYIIINKFFAAFGSFILFVMIPGLLFFIIGGLGMIYFGVVELIAEYKYKLLWPIPFILLFAAFVGVNYWIGRKVYNWKRKRK